MLAMSRRKRPKNLQLNGPGECSVCFGAYRKFFLRFLTAFAILPMIDFSIVWLDGFRSHFRGIVALSLSQMNPNKGVEKDDTRY